MGDRSRVSSRTADKAQGIPLWSALKARSWDVVQVKLLDLAATVAISTAVAALVSAALLVLSFSIVACFRLMVVPRGPSSANQELVFDFTAAVPTARASFLSPKALPSPIP
mmetsp:Transcript_35972/g.57858  ORF Transcript_35972/g.57858 Transcript_35972/m.57858 type:complete len:111 (-) Transcript_35972:116-448(-)